MTEHLRIKDVAKELNLSERTVRSHLCKWGFFQMKGSRIWLIKRSNLDLLKERANNTDRSALSVEEVKLCRSTKEKKAVRGGLISQPRVVRELDDLLARL